MFRLVARLSGQMRQIRPKSCLNFHSRLSQQQYRTFSTSHTLLKRDNSKNKSSNILDKGKNYQIYCEFSEDYRALFDFHEFYKQPFLDIKEAAISQIDSIKVGFNLNDLESFQFLYEDDTFEIKDVALINQKDVGSKGSKNVSTEYVIDLVEFPDLYDNIYNSLYDNFREQLLIDGNKVNSTIVVKIPKITQSSRKQKIKILEGVSKQAETVCQEFIKNIGNEIWSLAENDPELNIDKELRFYLKTELPKFLEKYCQNEILKEIEKQTSLKKEELLTSGNV